MRTTLTLEDRIARDLKRLAHRSGKPFKVVVNETLQAGLAVGRESRTPRRYRLRAASLGDVRRDVNLDQTLALADSLEDEALINKMEQRK